MFTPFHKPLYTYPYGRSVDETTTPKLATRVYDTTTWRFYQPWHELNSLEVESRLEAKFLAPEVRTVTLQQGRENCWALLQL
jgi:hypothetical protein